LINLQQVNEDEEDYSKYSFDDNNQEKKKDDPLISHKLDKDEGKFTSGLNEN
jgi:hypothetical protein